MKNKHILLIIFLSVIFFTKASWAASGVDLLQPASALIYNEDLIVNGAGKFKSIRIGEEGVGGVTYFNGTIINIGEKVPVTFGDDVRIDGMIWGGPDKGNENDQALKVADALLPGITDVNNLGSDEFRWKDLYIGEIRLKGNIIRSSAVTEYLSIPGAACSSGRTFPILGYCDNNLGVSFVMSWQVNLPDNVKISEFAGNLYDNAGGNMACNVWRVGHGNPLEIKNVASINLTSKSVDWRWLTDDSINYEMVNNSQYSYHIGCSGNASADVRAANFRIRYEKSQLD